MPEVAPVEGQDPVVTEPTGLEEILTDPSVAEETTGIATGFDLLTLIIAVSGVIVFFVLLVVSICACKKKKEANKIVMITDVVYPQPDKIPTPPTQK